MSRALNIARLIRESSDIQYLKEGNVEAVGFVLSDTEVCVENDNKIYLISYGFNKSGVWNMVCKLDITENVDMLKALNFILKAGDL